MTEANSAVVVHLPLPAVERNSTQALIVLARYLAAWRQANPNATVDDEISAAAEISKELGL